jgi:predicted nucleotidyltransferase
MPKKAKKPAAKKRSEEFLGYRYHSPNIPMSAIRRYARQIAERFHPDKIILFGSYAYGQPHEWSDVDILVVMPAYNQINQAIRIINTLDAPFSLDLIERTPKRLQRDWEDGDWFLREVLAKGKVLYEKTDGKVGAEGRSRPERREKNGRGQTPVPSAGDPHSAGVGAVRSGRPIRYQLRR